MVRMHSDAISHTGIGGTSGRGNLQELTGSPLRTQENTIELLGMFVSGGPVTGTAAEQYLGIWEVEQKALGLKATAIGPPYEGGAPATNVGHRPHLPKWIPFRRGSEANPIGAVDLTIRFGTTEPDVAVASAVAAAIVTTASGPADEAGIPESIYDLYRRGMPRYIPSWLTGLEGGEYAPIEFVSADEEDLATVAESALPVITMDQRGIGIAGFEVGWAPAVFGAEEFVGYVRLKSTLPAFEPQEWLVPGSGAPLGTAVGTGYWMPEGLATYPTWFPRKPGSLQTITPHMVWIAAVATSNPTIGVNVAQAIKI